MISPFPYHSILGRIDQVQVIPAPSMVMSALPPKADIRGPKALNPPNSPRLNHVRSGRQNFLHIFFRVCSFGQTLFGERAEQNVRPDIGR